MVPPSVAIPAVTRHEFVERGTRRAATDEVIGEGRFNSENYVLVSYGHDGVVVHRIMRRLRHHGPRNPPDAAEQGSVGKGASLYFDTSGAIALGWQLSNLHG